MKTVLFLLRSNLDSQGVTSHQRKDEPQKRISESSVNAALSIKSCCQSFFMIKFVKPLKASGFAEEQAEALSDAFNESQETTTSGLSRR